MTLVGPVLIDGHQVDPERATISVFDIGMQRGYGCFETLRSYAGFPFRMRQHLDRLSTSASLLRMELPDRSDLEAWTLHQAAAGDVAVKIFVTGGRDAAAPGTDSHTIVFAEALPDVHGPVRLLPLAAPWHPDGRRSELTGAKTLSYAPNIAARLEAVRHGFDDALLIGSSGHVLEGPTSGIGWITGDTMRYPALDLGVLASVTVAAVLEIAESVGLRIRGGRYGLDDVLAADEVVVMSTLSEVRPVAAIGDSNITVGDVVSQLRTAFMALVGRERAMP